MDILDVLRKKRDGEALSTDEMYSFVQQVAREQANHAQIGAMLMALYIRDLSDEETFDLTSAIIKTGEVLKWPAEWEDIIVDKHSTGGVGDKVSIVLTPIMAACGLKVPMLTGRSLGFTGGTLDKLESIPGFQSMCEQDTLSNCLKEVNCFMVGASSKICPADRILYNLRDTTNTVDNLNLIVASIISKKVASGCKRLVIDVKVGEAGFCKNIKDGKILAEKLISTSAKLGVTTRVILSRMEAPIGWAVGNSLEILESLECLRGEGRGEIMDLVFALGSNLLQMTNPMRVEETIAKMRRVIKDGSALKVFHKMLIHQGVTPECASELCYGDSRRVLPHANFVKDFKAKSTGYVRHINGLKIAQACWELGAGRRSATDAIDHAVGAVLKCSVNNRIEEGDTWLQLHHNQLRIDSSIQALLEDAITITSESIPVSAPLVIDTLPNCHNVT